MRSADNIKPSRRDHPRSGQPNNMVIGKETFSSSAFQIMLSSATRKGQVTCIGLKRKKSKSRQTRSSFAFFDLNNNGKYDWWEYILPILLLLVIEVIAELIAKFLIP